MYVDTINIKATDYIFLLHLCITIVFYYHYGFSKMFNHLNEKEFYPKKFEISINDSLITYTDIS